MILTEYFSSVVIGGTMIFMLYMVIAGAFFELNAPRRDRKDYLFIESILWPITAPMIVGAWPVFWVRKTLAARKARKMLAPPDGPAPRTGVHR